MQFIKNPPRSEWDEMLKRPVHDNALLLKQVKKIVSDVAKSGDKALKKYTKRFDGVSLRKIKVSESEIKKSHHAVSEPLKHAIQQALSNIRKFHGSQVEESRKIETMEGVVCWRRSIPIDRVGVYVPGGSAPLFSSVLMLGIPAQIAGCKEVVLCSPPSQEGSIHPAILYAADLVGIKEIYKCGGAQAIAAMAYGTPTIKKVYKIFGPGNAYVTAAKQLIQIDGVAIDMPAGPSEVCVMADSTANADFVAADLLSQAEHGPDSQVLLVTDSKELIEKTEKSVYAQLELIERKEIALLALQNSKSVLLSSMQEAIDCVNEYAPEHLIIASNDPYPYAVKVLNAGSVFLGNFTPESAGDYASGTNHTLPTNGFAKAYAGVSVDSFVKKVTYQHISEVGLNNISKTIIEMAEAESLDAHANAVKVRINSLQHV